MSARPLPLFLALVALFLLLPVAPAKAAVPSLPVEVTGDGAIVVHVPGKPAQTISQESFTAAKVENSPLRYVGLSDIAGDDVLPKEIEHGIYLFDTQGKAIARLSVAENAGMCDTMSLSPDGKMLAAGIGMDCRRVIFLWSYPDLRPVGQPITAFDPEPFHIFWTGKNDLLLNIPDGQDRQCTVDDCARSTVVLFSTATGHTEPLFRATDLCDYIVTGVQDGTVSVVEECVARLADWQNYEAKHRTRTLTKKLPATK